LADETFRYTTSKDGRVQIFHRGKLAKVLKGSAAQQLLDRVSGGDAGSAQLAMAKATGQYKFGNERRGK